MIVHCKKSKYDVYIGRPSKWGNPFEITDYYTREYCIEMYEKFIRSTPDLMAALPELKGKVLGCWCAPKPCHGDVLLKLLKEQEQQNFPPHYMELTWIKSYPDRPLPR